MSSCMKKAKAPVAITQYTALVLKNAAIRLAQIRSVIGRKKTRRRFILSEKYATRSELMAPKTPR